MNMFLKWLATVKKSIKRIKLVDRCLIIFMLVLMAQSTYNLFANETISQETNAIDIVVRTTSAAIFGYFLSVNFIKRPSREGAVPSTRAAEFPQLTASNRPPLTNRIGFSNDVPPVGELLRGTAQSEQQEASETSHQQIIIATIIGVFALCVLIFARNFMPLSAAMLGTLSQMRDFVSGCVGFLLGSPGEDA